MKKILYRFFAEAERMGELEGLFVSTSKEIDNAVGKTAYFGEALGKHSDIKVELEASNFQALSDDQDFIAKFEDTVGGSGYNPIDYIEE